MARPCFLYPFAAADAEDDETGDGTTEEERGEAVLRGVCTTLLVD